MREERTRARDGIPWWARIVAKIMLARLPIPYELWKSMHIFEHGVMDQPDRALSGFLEHANTGGLSTQTDSEDRSAITCGGRSVLEIGPGDSLYTAMIAAALGASRSWLVDSGAFATTDIVAYQALAAHLRDKQCPLPFDTVPSTLEEILAACNAVYLTRGVPSLNEIPTQSVDYHFSNAVLEHIPRSEFDALVSELRRIARRDSVGVHRVDLQDHLGGGLNNLRFSRRLWESKLFRNSGFYTNRIRFREMVGYFERAGFQCQLPRISRWESLPIPRQKLNAEFRALHDDDLVVRGFDIVIRPK